jgi:hypothetical protein
MKTEKIYVASSWRNNLQPKIVELLRGNGFDVYDFKEESRISKAFHWSEIDEEWKNWDHENYMNGLNHPLAQAGYDSDYAAMKWADTMVLVQPCGRSAHLELGWAVGQGKKTVMLLSEEIEPELMIKMVDHIVFDQDSLLEVLENKIICTPCNGTGSSNSITHMDPHCLYCGGKGWKNE